MSDTTQPTLNETPIGKLFSSASWAGLYLGAFWALKFVWMFFLFQAINEVVLGYSLFSTLGIVWLVLIMLSYRDSVQGVPAKNKVDYWHRKLFKLPDQIAPRPFSFSEGYLYGVMVFFFAAIIASVSHFFFYAYYLPAHWNTMEAFLMKPEFSDFWNSLQVTPQEYIVSLQSVSPAMHVLNSITNNMVWGGILCIPIAIVLRRQRPPLHPLFTPGPKAHTQTNTDSTNHTQTPD